MTAPKRQYSDEEKKFLFQGFTFQGRMFFPDLLVPKADDNGRLKYSLAFAFGYNTNQAEMAKYNQFWEKVKQMYFGTFNPMALVNPIKRDDTYFRRDGKPNHKFYKDSYFLNAQSGKDYQPQIVLHPTLQPCLDPAQIYSGRNVVIQVSFFLQEGPKQFGLGCNINAVMLMDGGERETGGSAPIDIASVFGSFAGDMNQSFQAQGQQSNPGPNNGYNPNQGQQFQAPPAQQQQTQQWNPNQAAAPQQQGYNPNQGHGYNPNQGQQGNGAQQGTQQNTYNGNPSQGGPSAPQNASHSNQQWQPFGNQGPQNTQQAAPPQAQGWNSQGQSNEAPQQQQAQQWNPNQQNQGNYSGKY